MTHAERRRYTRIQFDHNAEIRAENLCETAHLVDISLKGALIDVAEDARIRERQASKLVLHLDGNVDIVMHTRVVHKNAQRLGLLCTEIDMESMTHLRRLIELNIPEDGASERILDELIAQSEDNTDARNL